MVEVSFFFFSFAMIAQDAIAQINAACRLIVAGRSQARQLGSLVRQHGLNETEFQLLWLLQQETIPCDQKQIATLLGLSPAQVSGLVERLRIQGSIVASTLPEDRRRQFWQLAPAGEALVSQVMQSFAAVEFTVMFPAFHCKEAA